MINGENITKYKAKNKIYIPTELLDQDYQYTINNNEITIYTNENCYTNYNTTYCDCYRYNEQYNIQTKNYSCNVGNIGNYVINYQNLSDDINDSYRITRDYMNDYIIMFLIVILGTIIVSMFKNNSRRIK